MSVQNFLLLHHLYYDKVKIVFIVKMKLLCFLVSMWVTCFANVLFAQTPLPRTYEYDASGNRVLRKTLELRNLASATQDKLRYGTADVEDNKAYSEFVGEQRVTVYPNPTNSWVKLQFNTNLSSCQYKIVTSTGRFLDTGVFTGNAKVLDFSTYSAGVYLLVLTIEGETETWKIIKR